MDFANSRETTEKIEAMLAANAKLQLSWTCFFKKSFNGAQIPSVEVSAVELEADIKTWELVKDFTGDFQKSA